MEFLFFIGAVLFLVFVVAATGAAYRNGVTDGYGYAKEPGNPGYRKAGEYLKQHMAHRWYELRETPEPASGGLAFKPKVRKADQCEQ